MQTVHPRLVELALSEIGGSDFEHFFREFAAAIDGENFVPLGGVHDGGADGYSIEPIYRSDKKSHYYQASVEKDIRGKIRRTIARLRDTHRKPKVLWYYTSQEVRDVDILEIELSEQLECYVRIRHRTWISANINKSQQTQAAFENHLSQSLAFLKKFGAGDVALSKLERSANRTACVFLAQEVERRKGNDKLVNAVSDSLILWALEGTDPDRGEFMTKQQILAKIDAEVPFAKSIVHGTIDNRLKGLSSKQGPLGREINEYRKEQHYCLPYATRQNVYKENLEDIILREDVISVFADRASQHIGPTDNRYSPDDVARAAMDVIHRTFEDRGLELAAFLSSDEIKDFRAMPSITDYAREVSEQYVSTDLGFDFMTSVIEVIRKALYQSNSVERRLFSKISRT